MAKLLIVDDDKNLSMLYEQEFQDEGYEVVLAWCGPEALDYLKTDRPDLIVLDQKLSDSIDIYQGIKKNSVVTLNRPKPLTEQRDENIMIIGSVDATGIAVEEIETSITNTCMLGSFARTSGWIKLDSLILALEEYFDGDKLDKNIRAMTRGFKETFVTKY